MCYSARVVDRHVEVSALQGDPLQSGLWQNWANLFRIRTSEKYSPNSFIVRTYGSVETNRLKVLYNPHLQKNPRGRVSVG